MIHFLKKIFYKEKISQTGICHICDEALPDSELNEIDDLFLCHEDFELYKQKEWTLIAEGQSDPSNPEQALEIQSHKESLKEKGIKSFIKVSYQESNGEILTNFFLFQQKELS